MAQVSVGIESIIPYARVDRGCVYFGIHSIDGIHECGDAHEHNQAEHRHDVCKCTTMYDVTGNRYMILCMDIFLNKNKIRISHGLYDSTIR